MSLALTAVILAVQGADPPPVATAAPAGSRTSEPVWIRKPSGDDMDRIYPPDALRRHIEARVILDCGVLAGGTLEACRVVAETPPDEGFGAASLQLQGRFKMRPIAMDGSPVGGARVRIPITWRLPT